MGNNPLSATDPLGLDASGVITNITVYGFDPYTIGSYYSGDFGIGGIGGGNPNRLQLLPLDGPGEGRGIVGRKPQPQPPAPGNCTPGTKGCSNVPTQQELSQQQCLSAYNNSTIGKTIQFFSLYHLATNFSSAWPDWTVLPVAKITSAQGAKWLSQKIGGGEFLNITSFPTVATEIPSATSAVVDLAETAGGDLAPPAIALATATDIAINQACSGTFVPMGPVVP